MDKIEELNLRKGLIKRIKELGKESKSKWNFNTAIGLMNNRELLECIEVISKQTGIDEACDFQLRKEREKMSNEEKEGMEKIEKETIVKRPDDLYDAEDEVRKAEANTEKAKTDELEAKVKKIKVTENCKKISTDDTIVNRDDLKEAMKKMEAGKDVTLKMGVVDDKVTIDVVENTPDERPDNPCIGCSVNCIILSEKIKCKDLKEWSTPLEWETLKKEAERQLNSSSGGDRKSSHLNLDLYRSSLIEEARENMLEPEKEKGEIVKSKLKEGWSEKHKDKIDATADGLNTNLISKHYSPMIIRKYNAVNGWPLYVALICDVDLSDLDDVVNGALDQCKEVGMIENNIQSLRNVTGVISDTVRDHYDKIKKNSTEGIAVTLYIDKMIINSYFGDFMNHGMCRNEHLQLLNFMTQV